MSTQSSADIGRELGGRYRLVAPVGVGTSARVFMAVDTQLRRRVAVKVLHAALAADDSFLRRFRAEARAAAALSHPNIVAVYDWGEDTTEHGVQPYLVTEYLGGGSLRRILDRGRPLSPSQALIIGLDTARALGHAHRRGLIHRDVKPANLLFDKSGRLRLADFGLARALAEASWTEPTGTMLGTARYASPEQAMGRRLDGRSDVYSLALVLVECVTGQVPFAADTTAGTLALRTKADLPVPAELAELRGTLERAGRLDPEQRPDAAEVEISLVSAAEMLPRPEPLPLVETLDEAQVTAELRLVERIGGLGAVAVLSDPSPVADPADDWPDAAADEVEPAALVEKASDGTTGTSDADALLGSDMLAVDASADTSPSVNADVESSGDVVGADATGAAVHQIDGSGRGGRLAPDADVDALDHRGDEPYPLERSPIVVAEEHHLLTASRPASFGRVEPFVVNEPDASVPGDASGRQASSSPRRPRRVPRKALVALAVLSVLVAGAAWWFLIRVPVHDVPDLVGSDAEAVSALAKANGWHLDDDTVVPMVAIGPGITPGRVVPQMVSETDIAPTVSEAMGVSHPAWVDGRSFLGLAAGPVASWRTGVLSESLGKTVPGDPDFQLIAPPSFTALRTEHWLYVETPGEASELYDRRTDPYELDNIIATAPRSTVAALHRQLVALHRCAGPSCRVADALPGTS